jgi:hypothetical protein
MKSLLGCVLMVAFLLSPLSNAQDGKPTPDIALKELNRFVGHWEKSFTIYKSEWNPTEQARTGTHTCEWILNDRFVQEKGEDSDGGTYLTIYSYDAVSESYRASIFQSTGMTAQMNGKWDAATKTFTWTHEIGDGVIMTSKYQFVEPKEFKFSFIATDRERKVLFRLEGKGQRSEASKK